MDALILIVLTLISGLIVLVALLWAIIKWNNKSSRNTGCLVSFLFFILTILCGGYLIYKGATFIQEKAPAIRDESIGILAEAMTVEFNDTPHMKDIKLMQPVDSIIPEIFYTYGGFRDYYRMPLVYPYSISAIDMLEYGSLNNESGIDDITKDANASKTIVSGITNFSFNERLLIGKIKPDADDHIKYILFHFDNGELESFDTDKELLDKASRLEYDITKPMLTISEYYSLFFRN